MELAEFDSLLEKGESEEVEFKEGLLSPSSLAKLMVSFANTKGGTLFIGVSDKHGIIRVVGTSLERSKKLYETALAIIPGAIVSNFDSIAIDENEIAIIEVKPSAELLMLPFGAIKRSGGKVVVMAPEEIQRALAEESEKRQRDYTQFPIVIAQLSKNIEELSDTDEKMSKKIEEFTALKNQVKGMFISGSIGAILGAIITIMVDKLPLLLQTQ
jgi:hypothetical protein